MSDGMVCGACGHTERFEGRCAGCGQSVFIAPEKGGVQHGATLHVLELDPVVAVTRRGCGCEIRTRQSQIAEQDPCVEHALMRAADALRKVAETLLTRRMQ